MFLFVEGVISDASLRILWLCFVVAVFDKKDGPLTEEENDQYLLAKEKMLGNIKFIGEMFVCLLVALSGWFCLVC